MSHANLIGFGLTSNLIATWRGIFGFLFKSVVYSSAAQPILFNTQVKNLSSGFLVKRPNHSIGITDSWKQPTDRKGHCPSIQAYSESVLKHDSQYGVFSTIFLGISVYYFKKRVNFCCSWRFYVLQVDRAISIRLNIPAWIFGAVSWSGISQRFRTRG